MADTNPSVSNAQAKQDLSAMVRGAIQNMDGILDIMRFFSIGVESIDIDPINLTTLNDQRSDKHNIVSVGGKRFRIPVDRGAEDIMEDYKYIDAAFKEYVLEERKVRDYEDEYDKFHSKPEQRANRSKRVMARRKKIKQVGKEALKNKDVDHEEPLRNGGSNEESNLRVRSRSANRSDNGQEKQVREDYGAGFEGTSELLLRYLRDTPYAAIINYTPKITSQRKKKNAKHDRKKI